MAGEEGEHAGAHIASDIYSHSIIFDTVFAIL